ncbi:MAG: hypothetical protein ABJ310_04670 [Roseobacter sp.]
MWRLSPLTVNLGCPRSSPWPTYLSDDWLSRRVAADRVGDWGALPVSQIVGALERQDSRLIFSFILKKPHSRTTNSFTDGLGIKGICLAALAEFSASAVIWICVAKI